MLENQIRTLAARPDSQGPFLTLYIDTNRSDEAQRDRIRLFLKNELQKFRDLVITERGSQEMIDRGIRQIEDFVANELEPETRGVAIFSAPAEDYFLALQLPLPVEPELIVGTRPRLRQLARMHDEFPPVFVAMVDAKAARLFEVEFGRILSEIDMEHPDLPRGKKPRGRGQYANSAHVEEHFQDHVDRHQKEVAEVLTKLVGQRPVFVVLSGQERNVANFRGFLPKRVEEKVIATIRLDVHASDEDVLDACRTALTAKRQLDATEKLRQLETVTQKNGRGALGVTHVADAINQRKLEHLFVSRSADGRGWRCSSCSVIGHAMSLGCPVCGAPVVTVDLIDEFISAAHREDARIDFVAGSSILDTYGGVGALLRF
jgi:hypothetical protein